MPDPRYNKVLCCLDRSNVDLKILEFTSLLKKSGIVKHIKLLHVVANEIEEKAREYTDNEAWISYKNEIRSSILDQSKKIFGDTNDLEIYVKGGSALEVINTKSKSEAADLVIVGKKLKEKGMGIASHHIARSSLCDVLFVPENYSGKAESALFGYDFSEHAESTLELGYDVSKKLGIKYIKALNILPSPVGYFKSGRLHNEFVDSEKQVINKRWEKEIELHNDYKDIHFEILENEKNDISYYLKMNAEKLENPIIFLGSKGKTASSSFLLGSVTEKILMREIEVPIWIHKIGGENFDLFDALFKGD